VTQNLNVFVNVQNRHVIVIVIIVKLIGQIIDIITINMKQYELRDLETGKEYIVAYHNKYKWIPCVVKVVKEYTVKFVRPQNQTHSPIEFDVEYTIANFWYEHCGIDLFGNKFRMLNTFETFGLCQAWCEFENSINDYIENNGTEF